MFKNHFLSLGMLSFYKLFIAVAVSIANLEVKGGGSWVSRHEQQKHSQNLRCKRDSSNIGQYFPPRHQIVQFFLGGIC